VIGVGIIAALRRVPWQAWAVLAVGAGLLWFGHVRYAHGVRDERTRQLAAQTIALEAVLKQRDAIERAERARMEDVRKGLQRAQADELAKRDDTIRELRGGRLRLRERFTCPAVVGSLPATGGTAGGSDGATARGLSGTDAEFFIRLASEADAVAVQLAACQEAHRAR
jgi:hypothetical protein